jgi:cyclohexa-1,5-dienecarbonyl-CoA hydratase
MSLVNHTSNNGVHTITLDSSPGNVIDMALCADLRPAIAAASADEQAKVLVLRGAGKHFSFGASVEEHLPATAAEMLGAIGGVVRDLVGFPYPTVAAVGGRCLGGGLELALACGIVLAEDDAVLACPEIRLGVFPPAATALLTGRLAEDVLLTGRDLSADEAHRLGIVNAVCSSGSLDQAVTAFVNEHFIPRSAASLRVATRALREPQREALLARLDAAEQLYLDELVPLHDAAEGIQAFLDKREPEWKNR